MSGMMQVFCLFCTNISHASSTDSFACFWIDLIKWLARWSETQSCYTAVTVNNCLFVKWLKWHFRMSQCTTGLQLHIAPGNVIRDHTLLSFTKTFRVIWGTRLITSNEINVRTMIKISFEDPTFAHQATLDKHLFKVICKLMFLIVSQLHSLHVFFLLKANRETADKAAGPDLASPCSSRINSLQITRTSEHQCKNCVHFTLAELAIQGKSVNQV